MAALTRRVAFTATHHYRRPEWSDARNERTFGAASVPHGHDYRCDVTVSGAIDDESGMIVDLGLLDRVLEGEVRARFHGKDINTQVPEFGDGKLVPTCENLARFIYERLEAALDGQAMLAGVIVREDDTLSAEFPARN